MVMDRETEIAWAAGFFEGEGTIRDVKGIPRNDGHRQHYMYLQIVNTDLQMIERWKRIMGAGPIYHQKGPERNKPLYSVRIENGEKVKEAVKLLWPYLSDRRRERIEEVRAIMANNRTDSKKAAWETRRERYGAKGRR